MKNLKSIYLALSLIALIAIGCFLLFRPGMEGDTQVLVDGSYRALQCAREGKWGDCPRAEHFPILQYLPAWIMEILGAKKSFVIHVLAYLSIVSGVLSFPVMYRVLKSRGESLAWLGVLILSTGFWIRYINLSSNEMPASFVTLVSVAGVLSGRRLGLTAFCLWLAAMTKDTTFVFLLFWLGVVFVFVPEAKLSLRKAAAFSLAIVAGVGCNILFNLFRYGSIMNTGYMDLIINDREKEVSFFFAQWFSPAGGLWIFWTSFCLLLVAAAVIVMRQRGLARKAPGLAVFAIFLGLTLGFSKWSSPLGGYCWGDRFFLPWIPGLSLFLLWVYAEDFKALLRAGSARSAPFWSAALLIAVTGFPQYQFLFRQSLIGRVLSPLSCGGLGGWDYQICVFWQPWPWGILSFYEPFPRPDLFLLSAFLASWMVWICLKIRRATSANS